MAPIFTLWPLTAIATSTTTGIVVVATRFLLRPVFSVPFFSQANLLDFFDKKAFVEIVQLRSIVRFGRTDLVVLFFEVAEIWWKAMKKNCDKHAVGHIIFDRLEVSFHLAYVVCVLGHRQAVFKLECVESIQQVIRARSLLITCPFLMK